MPLSVAKRWTLPQGAWWALVLGLPVVSCASNGTDTTTLLGGAAGTSGGSGGQPAASGGGAALSGAPGSAGGAGAQSTGGASGTGAGGSGGGAPEGGASASAGTDAQGGAASGGVTATGGSDTNGGTTAGDGTSASGAANGGSSMTGGSSAAGAMSGGAASGGAPTGGTLTAGAATGGAMSGGTSGTGGGSSDDRCNVAVYDALTPPQSYAVSGGPSVHDPTVILANGVYYSANSGLSLWTRSSTNLTTWTNIKQGLGGANPSWIKTYVSAFDQAGGDLWAPDFSYFGGQYHLYYAASTFGSKTSCLGHATRAAMSTGAWADSGGPIICSNSPAYGSYTNVNWNTIDPAVILDPDGAPWLVFGSGWDGIHIVGLTTAGAIDGASPITNIARRSGSNVVENSYMVRRCGYYYLFMSWDKCCQGASSTYNIRVGRSTSMTGGFVDKDGVQLLSGGGTKLMGDGNGWVGPGAPNVVFNDARAYIVYHAYDASASGNVFAMHVSDLYFDDAGWPVTTPSP